MLQDQESTAFDADAGAASIVTFLLTDIEGSSELWESQPAAMRRALRRHDALLARGVAAHEGRLVKSRGEGDSTFAVFARAADAAAAACAVQHALVAEEWPTASPLRVRMALHTGEADLREGDYFGVAVNRCARLRDLANGGQIVLSQATSDLVREALPNQALLRSLGVYALRGSNRPEHIYQLVHPDLPDRFAPLKARPTQQSNLPTPVSSFVGREWEVGEIARLLCETRLLTLTGAGGCGKTRLALQVAAVVLDGGGARAVPPARDGVWLVELAPVAAGTPDAAALVVQAFAVVFGIVEGDAAPLDAVIAWIKPRTMLVVLDNCEHLVQPCATIASRLLAACPGLRILATSQEALGAEGEVIWRVPSLSIPEGPALPPLARLAQYEAVRLFMERARAQRPGLALTQANARPVLQICRRLDGIPLALELAAARAGSLSLDALAARLEDRFALLSTGPRGAPPRHQTLRAAMDWSYTLLGEAERTFLRRLSVFHGGWSLEAAEAICADQGEDAGTTGRPCPITEVTIRRAEVLGLLARVVAKSLVAVTEADEHLRYGLLETVRQYAAEHLTEGERTDLHARHCAWFLALAEEAEAGVTGTEQAAWLARLERDHDNLRAALTWSTGRGDGVVAVQLAAALWRFWEARGHLAEGRRWLELALEHGGAATPALRARAANGAGTLARRQGDCAAAARLHHFSLDLYRALGHQHGIAASLNQLGLAAEGAGDYVGAAAWYQEALAIRRELGDLRGMAFLLNNLGNLAEAQGDFVGAAGVYEESLAFAQSLDDRRVVATVLANMGNVARALQRLEAALALLTESLSLFRELEDTWGIGLALRGRALTLLACGEYGLAAAALCEGLGLHHELGDRQAIVQDLEALAAVAAAQDRAERAARLYGAAERLRRELGVPMQRSDGSAYAEAVGAVRAALGGHRCDAAWSEGSAMPLSQAVAHALEVAEYP